MPSPPTRWPPPGRFLASQLLSFALLLLLAKGGGLRMPAWGWVGAQGLGAALVGRALGLGPGWTLLNLGAPFLWDLLLRAALPAWTAPALLLGLLAVFGGGLLTRVPLYHSNREAWSLISSLLPTAPGPRFLDLGAGFGGPLAHLAQARPDGTFHGVEASPLNWAVASLRCLSLPNARVRLGSLWRAGLGDYDVVFAFLSPVPMARLWAKARREMRPGSLFLSHTFEVPGVPPDREIPLQGRRDAVLRVYVIPGED